MPLTRYEIRNEYSLSNPELYRAVAKDDPEGLLEGVAMAGLVGIVRQLGDLAEFAAEVFHDLHEEVSATAARGHDLLVRVQQLEVELPVIEKLILVESNHMNFSYNPGVEWHANICNEQNHLTQGDLPRFIRHAYQDCRGPPRLSLLDKFDVAGAGACLKRYTDPSFFKTEWASSELLKAEREQQNKKARKSKMKIHRRRNRELREAIHASHLHTRMHHSPLDVDIESGTQIHSPTPDSSSVLDVEGKSSTVDPTVVLSVEEVGTSSTVVPTLILSVEKAASLNSILKSDDPRLHGHATSQHSQRKLSLDCNEDSNNILESHVHDTLPPRVPVKGMVDKTDADANKVEVESPTDVHLQNGQADLHFKSEANVLVDDAASEIDHCKDAPTARNSELEIEPELKTKPMTDCESSLEVKDEISYELFQNQPPDNWEISHTEDLNTDETNINKYIDNPELMDNMGNVTPREISQIHQVDVNHISKMIQENSNQSSISSPSVKHDRISETEDYLDSESIDHVSETPQISEVNDCGYDSDKLSATFYPLPDPAISFVNGPHIGFSTHLDSLSSQEQEQTHEIFHQAAKIPTLERDKCIGSESEPSESSKELSPCSSPGFSVQHTRWRSDFAGSSKNSSDTDDDMNGMQISSSSLSSSTLSSPRPSTLTTTVFNMELECKLQSLISRTESVESSPKSLASLDVDSRPSFVLSSQDSMGSSPRSLDGISSKSLTSSAPHSPLSLIQTAVSFSKSPVHSMPQSPVVPLQQSPADDLSQSEPNEESIPRKDGTTSMSPRLPIEEPEPLPPSPPLPPLEWRMMIRTRSTLSGSSKNLESSQATQLQDGILVQDVETYTNFSEVKLEGNSDLPSETGGPSEVSCPASSTAGAEANFSPSEIPLKGSDINNAENVPSPITENVGPIRLNEAGAYEASLDPETEGLSDSSPPFSPDGPVPEPGLVKFGRKDSLIKAFALHHRTALRYPELSHFSRSGGLDGREVLLEQIRTGSFTLRHTKIEKQEPPRQITHINVAAILEKANAIRQAFVGSEDEDDDDDDWSDS